MKLSTKLITSHLSLTLIPLIILGLVVYSTIDTQLQEIDKLAHQQGVAVVAKMSIDALKQEAVHKLVAIRESRKQALTDFFSTIEHQVESMAENTAVVNAMKKFPLAFKSYIKETSTTAISSKKNNLSAFYRNNFGTTYKEKTGKSINTNNLIHQLDADSIALQNVYTVNNPNPSGEKHLLNKANDNSSYSKLHGEIHPFIRHFLELFGYYDIFLVDAQSGDIVYSVYKELDFTTSLKNGPYSRSNLGETFRLANALPEGGLIMSDIKKYLPSYDAPASFIGTPIFEKGKRLGVLIFQLPVAKINTITGNRAGLGKTGETILVGSDYTMRSDSILEPEFHSVYASLTNPAQGKVDTKATRSAILDGKSGYIFTKDYRGKDTIIAYAPVKVGSTTWCLNVKADTEEVLAVEKMIQNKSAEIGEGIEAKRNESINSIVTTIITICVISAIVGILITLLLMKGIMTPINQVIVVSKALSSGDLTKKTNNSANDEVATVAKAIDHSCENISGMIKNISSEVNSLETSSQDLASFSSKVESSAINTKEQFKIVDGATEQMSNNINSMASATEEMNVNVSSVSSSAKQMSSNMSTVASAIEEMTASIADVAKSAREASNVGNKGSDMAVIATEKMSHLNKAGEEIGKVTEVIKRIAEQTNLLALNATIEAASAGEAGKGFAVVAGEIKELAKQSAKAAEDISVKISGVQTKTKEAVSVIHDVTDVISKISDSASSITGLVEQQSQATNEIAKNVAESNEGAQNIARSISEISQGTADLSKNAGEAAKGARGVSKNIKKIALIAEEALENTQKSNLSVTSLSKSAEDIKKMVDQFKT